MPGLKSRFVTAYAIDDDDIIISARIMPLTTCIAIIILVCCMSSCYAIPFVEIAAEITSARVSSERTNPTLDTPSSLRGDRNRRRIMHAVGVVHEHTDISDATNSAKYIDPMDYLHPDHTYKTSQADGDDNAPTSPTTIENNVDTEQINNPLYSNRDDILNTTEAILTDLSDAPSFSNAPTPTHQQGSIIIHEGGGHYYTDDIFLSNMDTNDDPPSGGGYFGNGDVEYEQADFREFIAFVGWYAFLIMCCLLPTLCAYYRRRRNARLLHENLNNIQGRLAEIEQRRNEENGQSLDLDGENRDRDWEYLESLFGGPSNTGLEGEEAASRRRVMSDIMGSVGIRVLDLMERDVRRRKEKGRRIVAVLKETSLLVKECHLIAKNQDGIEQQQNVEYGIGDVEGDIELGKITSDDSKDDDNIIKDDDNPPHSIIESLKAEEESKDGLVQKVDQNDTTSDLDKAKFTPSVELDGMNNEISEQSGAVADDDSSQKQIGDEVANVEFAGVDKDEPNASQSDSTFNEQSADIATLNTPRSEKKDDPQSKAADTNDKDDTDNMQSETTQQPQHQPQLQAQDPPILSSLYEVDDPYVDSDDDEENKYTGLCIPCNPNTLEVASGETIPPSTRVVPASCIICLLQYAPGTYVTWSPNKDCTHCFHRDCILMWLLKKEEPYLCPCCRREFVPEAMMNVDEVEREREIALAGLDGPGSVLVLTPSIQTEQQVGTTRVTSPVLRYSNLPGSFSIGGGVGTGTTPDWGSLSNTARPLGRRSL